MVFVNAGSLGAVPGAQRELAALLTRRNDLLQELGCRIYEVGVSDDRPDDVLVVEVWDSAEAHRASLRHPEVAGAIDAARPLLSGRFDGFRFDALGSPLR